MYVYAFVIKFNAYNTDYDVDKFILYVVNNDLLTVETKEYLNSETNIEVVARELYDFYEFSKLFVQ